MARLPAGAAAVVSVFDVRGPVESAHRLRAQDEIGSGQVLVQLRERIRSYNWVNGRGALDHPCKQNLHGSDTHFRSHTLQNVEPGSRVVVRANHFPEWRAECDGKAVDLQNHEGLIAFAAPEGGSAVTLRWPQSRWLFWLPVAGLMAGIVMSFARRPERLTVSSF